MEELRWKHRQRGEEAGLLNRREGNLHPGSKSHSHAVHNCDPIKALNKEVLSQNNYNKVFFEGFILPAH